MRELGIVVQDELLDEIGVGGGARGDAGEGQLVDQTALDGAVEALTAAARLGRVGADVLDAEALEGTNRRHEAAAASYEP